MQNYIDKLKILRSKISNSPYIYISLLFLGVLVMIVAVIVILNQKSAQTKTAQTNNISQVTYGTLRVTARIKGSQFIFDNQVYYAPATITNINPGTYSVIAHNTGYIDETYPVTINAARTVDIYLKMAVFPANGSESAVLQNRGEDENEQAMLYENQTNQEIQERSNNYPLTNYLPQPFGSAMLDYHVNSDGTVQYVVYSLQGDSYDKSDYEQQIDNFIQSKGINPNTVSIQWE